MNNLDSILVRFSSMCKTDIFEMKLNQIDWRKKLESNLDPKTPRIDRSIRSSFDDWIEPIGWTDLGLKSDVT